MQTPDQWTKKTGIGVIFSPSQTSMVRWSEMVISCHMKEKKIGSYDGSASRFGAGR